MVLVMLFIVNGCGDRSVVIIYDRNSTGKSLPCLRLNFFPPDPENERIMNRFYAFSEDCPYTLEVSTKSGIHCNSTTNVPDKTTSNFPTAYLRLEVRRGMKLIYSYYIDLTDTPGPKELQKGFERLQQDLKPLAP
jgi:hypothetical protein